MIARQNTGKISARNYDRVICASLGSLGGELDRFSGAERGVREPQERRGVYSDLAAPVPTIKGTVGNPAASKALRAARMSTTRSVWDKWIASPMDPAMRGPTPAEAIRTT